MLAQDTQGTSDKTLTTYEQMANDGGGVLDSVSNFFWEDPVSADGPMEGGGEVLDPQ